MLAKEEDFIARFAARGLPCGPGAISVKKLEKIDRIEIPAEEKVMSLSSPLVQGAATMS